MGGGKSWVWVSVCVSAVRQREGAKWGVWVVGIGIVSGSCSVCSLASGFLRVPGSECELVDGGQLLERVKGSAVSGFRVGEFCSWSGWMWVHCVGVWDLQVRR